MKAGRSVVLVALVLSTLPGCSRASSTTCADWAAQSMDDQTTTAMKLIEDEGLDPTSSTRGVASVVQDIHTYCGVDALAQVAGETGESTNPDAVIGDAVSWSEYED